MTAHDARHEEILERVVTGDLSSDGDEIRELTEACPDCRDRLGELHAVVGRLEKAGTLQRDVLEAAQAVESAPGASQARAALERRAAGNGGGARGAPPWLRAAAALLAISAIIWAVAVTTSAPHSETYIGESLVPGHPVREASDYSRFEWADAGQLGPDGYYRVLIFPDEGDAAAIDRSDRLEETTWRPDANRTRSWPDRIRWEVRAYDMEHREEADFPRDRCSSSSWRP